MHNTIRKQAWRERSTFLWRLKGIVGIFIPSDASITEEEKELLNTAKRCIRTIIDNSVESSRELGFNAKYRDFLGQVITDKEYYERQSI